MGGLSLWHWLIVGIIVLLLFGKGRFSDMMGDVAKGIKSFKKGMSEDDHAETPPPRPAAAPAGAGAARAERRPRPAADAGRSPAATDRRFAYARLPDDRRPMLDIAPTELLLVALVALVVIGPKDLPRVMRVVGQWVGRARGMARHFRSGIDEMIRQAELEEMEKKWAAENERIMREHPPPSAESTGQRRLSEQRADRRRAAADAAADDAAPTPAPIAPPARGDDAAAEPPPQPVDEAAAAMKDIDDSRAPLMEHLVELRRRLLWSFAALGVRVRALPLFRAADLRLPRPAAAARRAGQADLHRHLRGVLRRDQGRLLRRDHAGLPDHGDPDLAVRRAGPLRQGEAGVPAVPADDAGAVPDRARRWLIMSPCRSRCISCSATRAMSAASSRRRCRRSAIISTFVTQVPVRLRRRLPAAGAADAAGAGRASSPASS